MSQVTKYNLFLDDVRQPSDPANYMPTHVRNVYRLKEWIIVRSYDEFVKYITEFGMPELISFDHDLGFTDEYYQENDLLSPGDDKSGMDCAKWLVDYCMDYNQPLPEFLVHSANPAGAENIQKLLENYSKHST